MTAINLDNQPKPALFRVTSRPDTDHIKIVDRTGGDYGAGLIAGMSGITRGEALGHGLWIDDVFLTQVADALTAAGEAGIKSRFTHPDMSADGLAKFLGRAKFGRVEAGQVLTHLHLAKSAHRSPDGDLAGYVLDRTEEDPASFGASIVFTRDLDAEAAFAAAHGASVDNLGNVYAELFVSPDPENKANLLHCRLASLEAVDLVDEPAANPAGMFHVTPIGELADLADYALGLSDTPPAETTALAVHPDRLRGFVDRYLANRKLQIVPLEDTPPDPPPPETAPTAEPTTPDAGAASGNPAPDDAPAAPVAAATAPPVAAATGPDRTLAEYCAAFGHDAGARCFLQGVPFEVAQQQTIDALRAENAELAERARSWAKLAAQEHHEPLPLAKPRKTLREMTRIRP